jgi:hypothetical protein
VEVEGGRKEEEKKSSSRLEIVSLLLVYLYLIGCFMSLSHAAMQRSGARGALRAFPPSCMANSHKRIFHVLPSFCLVSLAPHTSHTHNLSHRSVTLLVCAACTVGCCELVLVVGVIAILVVVVVVVVAQAQWFYQVLTHTPYSIRHTLVV